MTKGRRRKNKSMIVRVGDLEHARLKVWAHQRSITMSDAVRGRVADIIGDRPNPSDEAPQVKSGGCVNGNPR